MMKPFIGMKLKGRSDLVSGARYGEICLLSDMHRIVKNKIFTVNAISCVGNVGFNGTPYWYSMEMFEPIITNEK